MRLAIGLLEIALIRRLFQFAVLTRVSSVLEQRPFHLVRDDRKSTRSSLLQLHSRVRTLSWLS